MSITAPRRTSPDAAAKRAHHIADLHTGWAGYRMIPAKPSHTGWDVVIAAVLEVQSRPAPVLLRVDVLGAPPLLIDFRNETYSTAGSVGQYPSTPRQVFVARADLGGASDPRSTMPERPLAELLWQLSGVVSPAVFPRSTRERQYRISRWPDLQDAGMPPADIELASRLVLRPYSIAELAHAGRTTTARVTRLIRALETMAALEPGSLVL